jgi:LmbE family N-acetylglucosaminyl deacetylase
MHTNCEGSQIAEARPVASTTSGRALIACLVVPVLLIAAWCTAQVGPGPAPPACDNDALTAFDGLLVLAPHPDDEALAFGGLTAAYMRLGKPVTVVVVTDGDGYCVACRFWKSTSVHGPTCNAADLSNFATAEVDSFAEVRRGESAAAAAILGRMPPTFLGYPDTGLAQAWLNSRRGLPDKRLRRSDFARCPDCESCEAGYGGGPESDLTAATLTGTLSGLLAATPRNTLVATTHWLDGHADHAGLGNFVKTLNDRLDAPRAVLYAVIHAHSRKSAPHPDCWYPGPQALVCPCDDQERATEDPTFIADLRRHRMRPDLPAVIPGDAPYGAEKQLCLPEEFYLGEKAVKLAAVQAYRSQLGSLARGGSVPAHLDAIIDCNGYLISFVRRTEAFVLTEPATTTPSACDPAGSWEGYGGATGDGAGAPLKVRLELVRTGDRTVAGYLSWEAEDGTSRQEVVLGELGGRCDVTLKSARRPDVTVRGAISRDGKSLHGSWGGAEPGFLVVHR